MDSPIIYIDGEEYVVMNILEGSYMTIFEVKKEDFITEFYVAQDMEAAMHATVEYLTDMKDSGEEDFCELVGWKNMMDIALGKGVVNGSKNCNTAVDWINAEAFNPENPAKYFAEGRDYVEIKCNLAESDLFEDDLGWVPTIGFRKKIVAIGINEIILSKEGE